MQQVPQVRPALRPRSRRRSPPGPGSARALVRPPARRPAAQEVARAGPTGRKTRGPSGSASRTRPAAPRPRAQVSLGTGERAKGEGHLRRPGCLRSFPAPPDLGDNAPRPLAGAASPGLGAELPGAAQSKGHFAAARLDTRAQRLLGGPRGRKSDSSGS